MICTEVGELMQRQLDADLDENELTLLMTHLSECIACKELFERLTLLSGSLEQLPRVTPSINIVDSILPELDAIDRQRSSTAQKAKSAKMRWMTAAASVAAAAAVVIITSIGWNGSSAKDDASYDIAFSTESSASSDTRVSTPQGITPMFMLSDEQMMDRDTSTTNEISELSIEPMSSPMGITQYNTESPNEVVKPKVTDQSGVDVQKTERESTSTVTNEPTSSSSHEVVKQGGFTNKEEAESEEPEQMMGIARITENEPEEAADFGIASVPDTVKNYSPDELVYVVFEEHTIALYETSTDVLLHTWDINVDGSPSFIAWDMNGDFFEYEVSDSEGETYSFKVNISEREK